MQGEPQAAASGPVAEAARITSLDLIRGGAALGILLMNVVVFKFGPVPALNLSSGGSETRLDWAVGIFGEIFIDQKFMGLFSLLFGAGVMLFIERAATRGRRAILLNLWRNTLLLIIGILHTLLWEGDVLVIYALSSLLLVALRKLPPKTLAAIGVGFFLLSAANELLMQFIANGSYISLAGVWTQPDSEMEGFIGLLLASNYFMRGLGMTLLGAGLYRLGFMAGDKPPRIYRMTASIGLSAGLTLSALGISFVALNNFSREVAFIGLIPNTLGTIPAALGYMSLIILWDRSADNQLKQRLRAVGQMALTNYLAQSVLGVLFLTLLLNDIAVNRAGMLLFVLAIWVLQLWWSPAWLSRFRFGPTEWLWRIATYRQGQPLLIRN